VGPDIKGVVHNYLCEKEHTRAKPGKIVAIHIEI
jgi:hypothetical protein